MAADGNGNFIDWSKQCVKPQILGGIHISVVIPLIFGWPVLGLIGWGVSVSIWIAIDAYLTYKGATLMTIIKRARLWFKPDRRDSHKKIESEKVKKRYW